MKTISKIKTAMIILLLALPVLVFGQSENARDKIESAKIGLISERLGLSPEEAQKFWPVYNEYSQKRRENQRTFQDARRNYNSERASEQETKDLLELGRKTKERQLGLEKEYSGKLLNVISNRQLMSLHNAEREFRGVLLRNLEQRRNNQGNENQMRRENIERLKNKRNN